MKTFLIAIVALCFGAVAPAGAQTLGALARVVPDASDLRDDGQGVEIALALSQGVPFRVFTLDAPRRLVLDFAEVDWTGLNADAFDRSEMIEAVRVGVFRPGWSRMVLDLAEPLRVDTAAITVNGAIGAEVLVRLSKVDQEAFSATVGAPKDALFTPLQTPAKVAAPHPRQTGERPLVVVLDPGHGGIDPGAQHDGAVEAELMLRFARELKEALLRVGDFTVHLTRDDDSFVPLEARVSLARSWEADVLISLHADALAEGRASGATIYTLSDRASDAASQKLAERHDRADLLAGIDLSAQDDVIANVLMDLARQETAPRSDRLADTLVAEMSERVGLHKRPRLEAGFSVLKAPDIPSVLIELGFVSSPRDLARLRDAKWRGRAAEGIAAALAVWAVEDAAEAQLLRQ